MTATMLTAAPAAPTLPKPPVTTAADHTFLKLCTAAVQRRGVETLLEAVGIEGILDVFRRSPYDRRLHAVALYVLCSLVQARQTGAAQAAIAHSVPLLLSAAAQWPADVGLRVATLALLTHLCAAGHAPVLLENSAVDAVLQTMHPFLNSETVQAGGLEALHGLLASPVGRTRALRAGGAEAVLAAMQAHPTSATVQARGCQALSALCAADYQAPAVVCLGAVEIVADALHRWRGHPDVAPAACRTLRLLAVVEDARPALVAAGAVATVVAAMQEGPSHRDLQCDGSRLLADLGETPAYAVRVVQAGGPPALRAAAESFSQDADVTYYVRRALRTLGATTSPPLAPRASTPPMTIPRPAALSLGGSGHRGAWDSVDDDFDE